MTAGTDAPGARPGDRTRLVDVLVAIAVGVLAWTAYRSLTGGYFVRDDFMWLFDARRQWEDPLLFLTWRPSDYFRPLSNLFFGAEYALFGLDPEGYFLVHLGLHGLNAFLLYRVSWAFFGDRRGAIAAGLVFAALQRPSASVLWISGLVTLLVATAILMTVVLHMRFLRKGGAWTYVGTVVGVAACLLAKESGVIVGPLLVLAEARLRGWRSFLRPATLERYMAYAVLAGLYAWIQAGFAQGAVLARLPETAVEGVTNATTGVVANLPLIFHPFQADVPAVRSVTTGVAILAGLPAVLFLLGGWQRFKDAGLALAMTLLGFAPFLLFLSRSEVLTGRYFYLACLGGALALGLLFGAVAWRMAESLPKPSLILPALALALYLSVLVKGTDDYARTNFRYRQHGEAARLLSSFLENEVFANEHQLAGTGTRWLLVGAPVENLRHLACQVALFTKLSSDSVSSEQIDLDELEVRNALAAGGADWLLEETGCQRALIWIEGLGIRPYDPARDPRRVHLEEALTRSWRAPHRGTRTPHLHRIEF